MDNLIELLKPQANVSPTFEDLEAEANGLKDRLSWVAVTEDNVLKVEDLRTEANKFVKSVKGDIDTARKEYLKPFEEIASKALEAIAPLEAEAKTFSKAILETKRAKRQKQLEEHYRACLVDENGEMRYEQIPPFAEVVKDISDTLTLAKAKEAIENALRNAQTETMDVALCGSKKNIEKLKAYAKIVGVEWNEL